MNILIILPNLKGGGAEKLAVDLALRWSEMGHCVAFVLFNAEGVYLDSLPPEITVYNLKSKRFKSSILKLSYFFKTYKPNVIWANMWPITSISVIAWLITLCKGRLILTDHIHLSTEAKYNLNLNYFLLKLIIFLTYPIASNRTAVSNGASEDLRKLLYPLRTSVNVINNCVSPSPKHFIIEDNCFPDLWSNFTGKKIISVGNLKKQKNHKLLIEAFSILNNRCDAILAILGEGELRSYLESYAEEIGISEKVLMPGFVKDLSPWYKDADLFVLSSEWEGFGNVLIEALSHGLPIVSTDCDSGPAEILENGLYGSLVKVNDPIALSDSMYNSLQVLHDKSKLIKRSEVFSVVNIADQYLRLFKDSSCMPEDING